MKGQAVNIDWVVALGLFILTLVSGLLIVTNSDFGPNSIEQTRQKTSLTQEELEKETFIEGKETPLYVESPVEVGKVPVDQSYFFSEKAYPESPIMDVPSWSNVSNNRVVTIVKGKNSTHHLDYFLTNTTNKTYSSNIKNGIWLNNTFIKIKPGNPGLKSLQIQDKEVLNTSANLNGDGYTTDKKEIYGHTLSNNLKIYNGSKEIILENPNSISFDLKNFTTLYWHKDHSNTSLVGTGTFKNGKTSGFSIASSYGITFIGNLTATVSKPDRTTVKAEIDAERLRIFLHNSGYVKGWKRIKFHQKGNIYFGIEKNLRGASRKKIGKLKKLSQEEFANRLQLQNFEYNITFGSLEKGSRIPFKDVVVSDRPSVILGRRGNYSTIESRVAIWR